ncbi:SMP-30/gluconolactonase/LRE family protein [Shewanella electrodiphila]|uniref:SMP-30/gluconolactonase/LRE family protein n=1 Tax=Shewanella electrodiphila TaxID=934143 RepID=A0ABT0KSK4_9GAMM|nr:SMP-30/gluconolactonase/LRE family protein [Shewanella electrodiphila]MCL1046846.1 SMP-30/gluconolactonase/LRE family protein [Shewanella electrodiphila]
MNTISNIMIKRFFTFGVLAAFSSHSIAVDKLHSMDIKDTIPEIIESCPKNILPLASDLSPLLITSELKFLEGPTWSRLTGKFYFSEMDFNSPQTNGPEATIYSWSEQDGIELFIENSGTNGLLAENKQLISMNHDTRSVNTFSLTTKERMLMVNDYNSAKFNSPNDLIKHPSGELFFTDPDWQLSERPQQTPFTGVYKVSEDNKVTLLSTKFIKPNGISLSSDNKTIYIGDYSHQIFAHQLTKNNELGELLFKINIDTPDGINVDCAGNIYAASHNEGNLYVYNPQGELLQSVYIAPKITNLAFGGQDLKTILVTTGNGLFTFRSNIPGITPTHSN